MVDKKVLDQAEKSLCFTDVYQTSTQCNASEKAINIASSESFKAVGNYQLIRSGIVTKGDDRFLQVYLSLTLQYADAAVSIVEDSSEFEAVIGAEYLVWIGIDKDAEISKEMDAAYAELSKPTAMLYAWPYFCEFVSSSAARMRLPNLAMPIIKI
jgi:hypothetical protein